MKRAAIYDPYLDTGGGGERYVLSFANTLKKHGWEIDLQWKDKKILKWLEERLGLDLSGINTVRDVGRGAGYDLVFWVSDGSVPHLFSKKNILHFQTPFQNVGGKSIFNFIKLKRIESVLCNSKFTKAFIDKEYGVKSSVLYPPVQTESIPKDQKKEKIIIYVGRYSKLQQSKGQDVLVDSFKSLCSSGLKGWRLVLIGGSNVGGNDYVQRLKIAARGFPIDILENLPYREVVEFYKKARIYWSASGFGIDEEKEPQRVEHFGITVVEAMAYGAIPVVCNKGGHKEIISSDNGFLWDSTAELKDITLNLINDPHMIPALEKRARKDSQAFFVENFDKEVLRILKI